MQKKVITSSENFLLVIPTTPYENHKRIKNVSELSVFMVILTPYISPAYNSKQNSMRGSEKLRGLLSRTEARAVESCVH